MTLWAVVYLAPQSVYDTGIVSRWMDRPDIKLNAFVCHEKYDPNNIGCRPIEDDMFDLTFETENFLRWESSVDVKDSNNLLHSNMGYDAAANERIEAYLRNALDFMS